MTPLHWLLLWSYVVLLSLGTSAASPLPCGVVVTLTPANASGAALALSTCAAQQTLITLQPDGTLATINNMSLGVTGSSHVWLRIDNVTLVNSTISISNLTLSTQPSCDPLWSPLCVTYVVYARNVTMHNVLVHVSTVSLSVACDFLYVAECYLTFTVVRLHNATRQLLASTSVASVFLGTSTLLNSAVAVVGASLRVENNAILGVQLCQLLASYVSVANSSLWVDYDSRTVSALPAHIIVDNCSGVENSVMEVCDTVLLSSVSKPATLTVVLQFSALLSSLVSVRNVTWALQSKGAALGVYILQVELSNSSVVIAGGQTRLPTELQALLYLAHSTFSNHSHVRVAQVYNVTIGGTADTYFVYGHHAAFLESSVVLDSVHLPINSAAAATQVMQLYACNITDGSMVYCVGLSTEFVSEGLKLISTAISSSSGFLLVDSYIRGTWCIYVYNCTLRHNADITLSQSTAISQETAIVVDSSRVAETSSVRVLSSTVHGTYGVYCFFTDFVSGAALVIAGTHLNGTLFNGLSIQQLAFHNATISLTNSTIVAGWDSMYLLASVLANRSELLVSGVVCHSLQNFVGLYVFELQLVNSTFCVSGNTTLIGDTGLDINTCTLASQSVVLVSDTSSAPVHLSGLSLTAESRVSLVRLNVTIPTSASSASPRNVVCVSDTVIASASYLDIDIAAISTGVVQLLCLEHTTLFEGSRLTAIFRTGNNTPPLVYPSHLRASLCFIDALAVTDSSSVTLSFGPAVWTTASNFPYPVVSATAVNISGNSTVAFSGPLQLAARRSPAAAFYFGNVRVSSGSTLALNGIGMHRTDGPALLWDGGLLAASSALSVAGVVWAACGTSNCSAVILSNVAIAGSNVTLANASVAVDAGSCVALRSTGGAAAPHDNATVALLAATIMTPFRNGTAANDTGSSVVALQSGGALPPQHSSVYHVVVDTCSVAGFASLLSSLGTPVPPLLVVDIVCSRWGVQAAAYGPTRWTPLTRLAQVAGATNVSMVLMRLSNKHECRYRLSATPSASFTNSNSSSHGSSSTVSDTISVDSPSMSTSVTSTNDRSVDPTRSVSFSASTQSWPSWTILSPTETTISATRESASIAASPSLTTLYHLTASPSEVSLSVSAPSPCSTGSLSQALLVHSSTHSAAADPRLSSRTVSPAAAIVSAGVVAGVLTSGVVSMRGSVGAPLVSMLFVMRASRLQRCADDNTGATSGEDSIGASLLDNPTTLSVPAGPFPLASGAVVGNVLLVCCAAGVARIVSVRWPAIAANAVALLRVVWDTLQVPTVAAVAALLTQLEPATAAVCAVGAAVFVAAPVAGAVWSYRRAAHLRGIRSDERRNASRHWAARLQTHLLREDMRWERPRIPSFVALLARDALAACCYPRRWVMLHDATAPLLQGALLGVIAGTLPCSVAVACGWGLFAVCAACSLLVISMRIRPTVLQDVATCLMSLWTTVIALLVNLGLATASEWLATVQGVVALLLSVAVFVAFRCSVDVRKDDGILHLDEEVHLSLTYRKHQRRSSQQRALVGASTNDQQQEKPLDARLEKLRELIELACAAASLCSGAARCTGVCSR